MATQKILFAASNPTTGTELWITDSTSPGTSLVKDIISGPIGSNPFDITFLANGKALFETIAGYNILDTWVTDGTAAGTSLVRVSAGAGQPDITSLGNGAALFRSYDPGTGYELWKTDGTGAGTSLVKDIFPGTGYSNPFNMLSFGNGTALFSATDGASGTELWISDGTSAGTSIVKDVNAGAAGSSPTTLTALGNGKVLFDAFNDASGQELWVTDGTSGGTSLLKDINPGTATSAPHYRSRYLTPIGGGKALFAATNNTQGTELWVTDGTLDGTSIVVDLNPGSTDSFPGNFTLFGNGKVLFSADNGVNGPELWVTDGTAAGTSLVKDIYPGVYRAFPPYQIAALGDGRAVFTGNDGTTGRELWISDGTPGGTSLVKDIYAGAGESLPRKAAVDNGTALFVANNQTQGFELWATDGTSGGTSLVQDIAPGIDGSFPTGFAVLVACFASGTRIETADGPVLVENLCVGNRVRTLLDGSGQVVWIGHRTVDCARHPKPETVWPIRVACGAFGPAVPERDLYLSPDHAVYVKDVLIPIKLLVNGASIQVVERATVTYYHLELSRHNVVLAEGLPTESYLDTGDRTRFANGGSIVALHPNYGARAWEMEGCAQLVLTGGILDTVRNELSVLETNAGRRRASLAA